MAKETELKVMEAYQRDIGRGIARLSSASMEALGVSSGDIISIHGKKDALGIVWRAQEEDEQKEIIRIDGVMRYNAGVSLDDMVKVSKADSKPAAEIRFSPDQGLQFGEDFVLYIKQRIMNMPLLKGNVVQIDIMGRGLPLTVVKTKPAGIVRIADTTQIFISEKPVQMSKGLSDIRYEDIGGLRNEIEDIREMIEIPMRHPEVFKKLGISPPKGVMLYGPPGCGKTLLAKAVATETDAHFIVLNGPEIMSKWYGQSEENLRNVFEDAQKNAPSIIFIDEIDAIAPKREDVTGEVEKRVVSQLLTLMDGLEARGDVVVIAATNRKDAIDPALRRPGRFDRELEIGVPDKEGRNEILLIHTRGMPLAEDVTVDQIAEITYGFTGADLSALTKEAAMRSLRRIMPEIKKNIDAPLSKPVLDKLTVTKSDFIEALKKVEPSAMREVLLEIPNVKWSDVGGLENVKQELQEAIEWPLKHPQAFKKIGIDPPRGILLYGPPGCGKTLLAKAVATESNSNFISVKGPEILDKYVGESEKAVRRIFSRAKQVAPSIIFFDEIDSLVSRRGEMSDSGIGDRVVAQILNEIDGVSELKDVVIIAATNRPDLIDPALLRPGRFDRLVYIPIPDDKTRDLIFKVHTGKMSINKNVAIDDLVQKTKGYTGADISAVCKEAGMLAIREALRKKQDPDEVTMAHFKEALTRVKPSLTDDQSENWEKIRERLSKRSAEVL